MIESSEKDEVSRIATLLSESIFHDLDFETRNRYLVDWVRNDNLMRRAGQKVPVWDGHYSMTNLLNHEVVAKTDHGEQIGKAIYIIVKADYDGVYKHALLVHIPSSGSLVEVLGRDVRPASDEDRDLMKKHMKMADTVKNTNGNVENRIFAKKKTIVGTHLYKTMMKEVERMGLVVDDKTQYHKIYGNKKGISVYFMKNGGRADLSGFDIDHVAVEKISKEEATKRHLGKVRGTIDFNRDDELIMEAWKLCLEQLG